MPALEIAALWIAFWATHMLLSSVALRPRLVGALGDRAFLGVYSLVALALFVPLVSIYFGNQHAGAHLFYLGGLPGARWVGYALMGAAFALAVAGLARPSPASLSPGRPEPAGALRITRHPVFMAAGIFGVAHLLTASVNASELAFFGGFPLFAVLGSWHQDMRKLASGDDAFLHFHDATPFLPFSKPSQALLGLREDAIPIVIGIGVTFVIRYFHASLFS
jgi:uncharacterized membrane protein